KAHETLTYFAFPSNHWRQVKTNNPLEWIIREILADENRYCPDVLGILDLRRCWRRQSQQRRRVSPTPGCAGESIPRKPRTSSLSTRHDSCQPCPARCRA